MNMVQLAVYDIAGYNEHALVTVHDCGVLRVPHHSHMHTTLTCTQCVIKLRSHVRRARIYAAERSTVVVSIKTVQVHVHRT